MAYCNNRLEYKECIKLNNCRLSVYQKVYKYAETEDEFNSVPYKGTKDYRMYLHNSSQPYDCDYDFELLLDLWQLEYVKKCLESSPDWTYDKVKGWFKEMCEQLNSLTRTSAGPFGNRLVYIGKKTTELMKQYHVFNKEISNEKKIR